MLRRAMVSNRMDRLIFAEDLHTTDIRCRWASKAQLHSVHGNADDRIGYGVYVVYEEDTTTVSNTLKILSLRQGANE